MRKYDLIVFDLDGTLFDTRRSIINSIKHMLLTENIRKLTDEEVRTFLGPPLEASMKRYYPELPEEEINRLIEVYRKHYVEVELLNTNLYDGMDEVLKTLKSEGYKVALGTYKNIRCVTPLFDHFDITKYFDALKGTEDGHEYTKVQIIQHAIEACGIKKLNKVCMIGDTEHDFRGAIQCGIDFIGMTYGFGYMGLSEKELKYENFLGYCDRAIEILDKLK